MSISNKAVTTEAFLGRSLWHCNMKRYVSNNQFFKWLKEKQLLAIDRWKFTIHVLCVTGLQRNENKMCKSSLHDHHIRSIFIKSDEVWNMNVLANKLTHVCEWVIRSFLHYFSYMKACQVSMRGWNMRWSCLEVQICMVVANIHEHGCGADKSQTIIR